MLGNIKNKGFTLIETVVALALILGSAGILSKVAFTGIKVSNKNKEKLQTLIIAQNQLEVIRANRDKKNFNDMSSIKNYLKDSGFKEENIKFVKIQKLDNKDYTTTININEVLNRFIEIVVEVNSTNGQKSILGTKLLY